jgi:ribonuclease VapC
MNPFVLDASAVMSILLKESGSEKAAHLSEGALMSSVNAAEVLSKCVERGYSEELALLYIHDSDISIVDFDLELATLVGQLCGSAVKGVLSLGDRACIATAILRGGTAVTADCIWATLDLDCPIELIR